MKTYIEREAVIETFLDWGNHCITDAEMWHIRQIIGDMKSIPAANVRENVTGEWMQVKDGDWAGGGKTVCSQCQYGYSWKMYFEVERFNFCPNCGAKMEVNDVRS